MSPRGLVTCVSSVIWCVKYYITMTYFPSALEAQSTWTPTQRKHIYYIKAFIVVISWGSFPLWNCKPISLGYHLRWFIPIFKTFSFFFTGDLSSTEGWFPCACSPSHFLFLFVIFSFQPSWWGPNCLKSVDESFVLFISCPKSHTTQYISR